MSEPKFNRRFRVAAVLVGASLAIASCGGSDSAGAGEKRTRNAALGISTVSTARLSATQVAGGGYHSLALDELGNMYAFGAGGYGQTTVPGYKNGGTRFTAIAAGELQSLALDDKGNMYAFGTNGYGQTTVPGYKNGGTRFTAIAAGAYHSLALDDKGNMYAFGANGYGQTTVPGYKNGGTRFTAMSAGGYHSLALDDKGNMYAFGAGGYGQTTVPPLFDQRYLRTMPIAMGGSQAYAINESGEIVDLVHGGAVLDSTGFLSVAAGYRHGLGITRSGEVIGWGDSPVGQVTVPEGTGSVIQVVAGYSYSAALRADGTVVEWGAHSAPAGKLKSKPADLPKIIALAGGATHILGLTVAGTVVGWGNDANGQSSPPPGLANVIAIAANGVCSVALSGDGTLTWWGVCLESLRERTSAPGATTIVLTDASAAALVTGSILTWGDDVEGLLTPPTGTDFVALSAGSYAALAVDSKGNVSTWGTNSYETITIPEGFGGPAPVIDDGICEDCAPTGPITISDDDLDQEAAFFLDILPKEQRDRFITNLGGSTTKPLTPEEIQALVDSASAKARAQALAEANATRVDPATVPAPVLPAAQSPATKVGITVDTKKAISLLGLNKVSKVTFAVPKKASVGACTVTKTQVIAVATGTCNVKVNYTDAKKKKRSTTLTLLIG